MFTNKCKVKENTKDKTLEVWVTFKLLKFVSGEMHHASATPQKGNAGID